MNKEDKKIQEDLVNEMMKVSKTNPDVMIYMQSLMKCYEDLEKENQQLKKQKDDVVEYCNKTIESLNWKKRDIMQILTPENGYLKADIEIEIRKYEDLLRMLGDSDV